MRKIITADALEGLRTLPDGLCDMCVTSPPYWGLRDYGTAEWEGGDSECEHKIPERECDPKRRGGHNSSSHVVRFYRVKCYKCGAIRRDNQIGLEENPGIYIQRLVNVFKEVWRVLRADGTLWVNIGDTYNGYKGNAHNKTNGSDYAEFRKQPTRESGYGLECKDLKPKDLVGIPWLLAFALRADGWYLRQDIIWHKPNPMPESVKDRCTKSHEYIFLLSKSQRYYFDNEAIKEPCSPASVQDFLNRKTLNNKGNSKGSYKEIRPDLCRSRKDYMPADFKRNKRDVWSVKTHSYKGEHFATFPSNLIRPCIQAGSRSDGIVLDPFFGSGTTGEVAIEEGRGFIGVELNPQYVELAKERTSRANKIQIQ